MKTSPCFNRDCQHNDRSDSGCKRFSRYTVDLCESYQYQAAAEKIELAEQIIVLAANFIKGWAGVEDPMGAAALFADLIGKYERLYLTGGQNDEKKGH